MPVLNDIFYFASKGGSAAKPPVVLIHGAGGFHLHWPHNIRRLPGHRVFALDLPGHGKSGGVGEQSIKAYAQAVRDFLLDLGLYRAVFVGHSMGAAVALSLALDFTEHVLGLGLVSAGARLPVEGALLDKLSRPATIAPAIDQIVESAYRQAVDPRQRQLFKEQLTANRPAVLHGDYLASSSFDVRKHLARIAVPAAVICGEDDQIAPPRLSEELAKGIGGATLTLIPNTGHMAMIEQPEAVAAAILALIDKVKFL